MTHEQDRWVTIDHPGYLGKRKEEKFASWNKDFGENNWRLIWELADKTILDYSGIFWRFYVPGYASEFQRNLDQAKALAKSASFTYDKDLITKEQAFDEFALFEKPGIANQFHHVALNIALEYNLGIPFYGETPLQVREGKPGTDENTWPKGWIWSPGRIPNVRPDLTPKIEMDGWWKKNSIEELYQKSKVLQVKQNSWQEMLSKTQRTRSYED